MKGRGKDSSRPLEMTIPVISNPFDALRVTSGRDLSLRFFKGAIK